MSAQAKALYSAEQQPLNKNAYRVFCGGVMLTYSLTKEQAEFIANACNAHDERDDLVKVLTAVGERFTWAADKANTAAARDAAIEDGQRIIREALAAAGAA